MCIDPNQTINKAIEVPKYRTCTVDELLPKLNNPQKIYCVAKGLTNIELDQ